MEEQAHANHSTHKEHDITTARVLFMAFALRKNTWNLGAPRGLVKSLASALSRRVIKCVCSKK
jgi:hypothetical protein